MSYLIPAVIEKISMGERAFDIYLRLFGTQWHPEELNDAPSRAPFDAFIGSAHEEHKKTDPRKGRRLFTGYKGSPSGMR